jgi:thiol-activated cytolysin
MAKYNRLLSLSTMVAGLGLVAGTACSVDLAPPGSAGIDSYIESLPYLPVDPAQVVQGTRSSDSRDGDYSCSTQNLKETRQYDRIVAYAANSDSLWPGAIVGADSIGSGLFTQIVLPRAPATISVSLENLGGKKTATIPNPSLSTFRDALSGILSSEVTGATAANIYSEIEQVHSEQQLNMALGVQASWGLGVASLKTSFDFAKKEVLSRYVVRYTQAYYTVDLDAPSSPSALLSPGLTVPDIQGKMNETNPPVYVSSVTYGRMVLFTFESNYSSEEMGAALNFAYQGGVDVKGDVSVSYKDIISKSKITAFILGGDGSAAAKTIDSYDALIAFIKDGGNYSKESPGAPIAYKLSYLKDNSPARMSYTTDYDVKECVRVSQQVKIVLENINVISAGGDSGNDLEIYGNITAAADTSATLFSKDSNNYVQVHEGAVFPQGSNLAEAVINVTPKTGQTIQLHSNLKEYDTFSPDDSLGDEIVLNPFETGWRKEVSTVLTGSGAQVKLTFSLTPI